MNSENTDSPGPLDGADSSASADASPPEAAPTPPCPKCGKPMVLRTARTGPLSGHQFWGCSTFPRCKGTLRVI